MYEYGVGVEYGIGRRRRGGLCRRFVAGLWWSTPMASLLACITPSLSSNRPRRRPTSSSCTSWIDGTTQSGNGWWSGRWRVVYVISLARLLT